MNRLLVCALALPLLLGVGSDKARAYGGDRLAAAAKFSQLHGPSAPIISLSERVTYDWLEANEELITNFFAGTYRAEQGKGDVCLFPSRLRAEFTPNRDYDKATPRHKLFAKIPWGEEISFDVDQCYLIVTHKKYKSHGESKTTTTSKVQLFEVKSNYPIVKTSSREKIRFNAGLGSLEFVVRNGGHVLDGGLWRDRWVATIKLKRDKEGNINVTETERNLSPIPIEALPYSKKVSKYRLVRVN